MGYELRLNDSGLPVKVNPHAAGVTVEADGSDEAVLSVSSNWAGLKGQPRQPGDVVVNLRRLHGQSGRASVEWLELLQQEHFVLGEGDGDPWNPSPENLRDLVGRLLSWARLAPDAEWEVLC